MMETHPSNNGMTMDASESHHSTEFTDPETTKEQQEEIAKKESQAVQKLRILVLVTLLCSAIAVSLCIYFYLRQAETSDFEDQFRSDAAKLLDSIGKTIDDTLGATDAFCTKMVASARESNSSWPYVTIRHFSLQASKVLKLSKAFHMAAKHIVYPHQRQEWEAYADSHNDWIQESLDIQENLVDWRFPIIRHFNVSYNITGLDGAPVPEPYPYYKNSYLPQWQSAPIITGPANPVPYNRDIWTLEKNVAANELAIRSKMVTWGGTFWGIIMDPNDPVEAYVADLSADWSAAHLPVDEAWRSREPSFSTNYPLIDAVDKVEIDVQDPDLEVVGLVTFSYFFRHFLEGILPPKTKGIRVVVENECGPQVFTYQVDAEEAIYLGQTDVHETKYDHLVHEAKLGELVSSSATQLKSSNPDINTNNNGKASHYTGVPLKDDFCPKTIKIYPSSSVEDEYHTHRPALFAAVAALIFLFTSFVFVFYDWLVARRQRIVLGRAKASGAIVNSLFPEAVRQQLYEEQESDVNNDSPKNDSAFVNGSSGLERSEEKSRPIAQVYEETTVFFMDLAGFTAWSSRRSPVEIFELLEAVYSQFDEIARRRQVYKVETIGDCYVAVTGIPNKQEQHAVIMVKFARDCMLKFSQVRNDLVQSLGADTAALEMRIGLHSGPTTGGVLRGDKGRFQLFGDTVNTASRMESNGVKGRIHCSEATANALIAKGRESWLTPREDKITVKGKGLMSTFFVNPTSFSGRESMCESMRSGVSRDSGILDNPPVVIRQEPSSSPLVDIPLGQDSEATGRREIKTDVLV